MEPSTTPEQDWTDSVIDYCNEIGVDHKSTSREDLLKIFNERLEAQVSYRESETLKHLITLLGEHKFWG